MPEITNGYVLVLHVTSGNSGTHAQTLSDGSVAGGWFWRGGVAGAECECGPPADIYP